MNKINSKIMLRRDSEQNWKKENPKLLFGEVAIVDSIDSTYLKIGNGFSHFVDLPNLLAISLSKIYPIGSVYLSVNKTNPKDLFGFGTWIELDENSNLLTNTAYSYNLQKVYAWHRIK